MFYIYFSYFQALHHLTITFVLMTFAISVGTSNLFFYCYFGKYATDYLAAFANCLFQSNWFMMSNQIQKPFVIMIAYAQIPCIYHGSNIANLNLELFTGVSKCLLVLLLFLNFHLFLRQMLKTIISYYLTFKTLTAES